VAQSRIAALAQRANMTTGWYSRPIDPVARLILPSKNSLNFKKSRILHIQTMGFLKYPKIQHSMIPNLSG